MLPDLMSSNSVTSTPQVAPGKGQAVHRYKKGFLSLPSHGCQSTEGAHGDCAELYLTQLLLLHSAARLFIFDF